MTAFLQCTDLIVSMPVQDMLNPVEPNIAFVPIIPPSS